MARLLIFDTGGAACSVAVWADGGVVAGRYEAMPRGQAERLLPMVEETLAAAGVAFGQLDAVGVTRGPGAFTGLRIGLAAARGMALALDIPAIGITTFEALAVRAPAGCVVAIDTKRNDFFCQRFGPGGTAAGEPEILGAAGAISQAAASSLPLISDSPALAGGRTGPGGGRVPDASMAGPPRAAAFASLVAERHRAPGEGGPGALDLPRPLYLRPPEARLPEARRPGLAR